MNKYIPTMLAQNVYNIDFAILYEQGIRNILFDLDNTIATYEQQVATPQHIAFFKQLKTMGLNVYILSNNRKKRVYQFIQGLCVDGALSHAQKPFSRKIANYLRKNALRMEETILIGDQLLTDISCANRLGIKSILVQSISRRTEKWYTRINRQREKKVIQRIEKENSQLANELRKMITKEKNNE
ncbi:MAG: YqeG family HAD IIIA-type phosphatase [Prevotella sp.]|nr:YqeG family HAD IIIA-type phosphatase [Staphylococcus sp.]MCM1349972.1 YqeG family HAD IIIA-type phosphatase [Prevotella sp.]